MTINRRALLSVGLMLLAVLGSVLSGERPGAAAAPLGQDGPRVPAQRSVDKEEIASGSVLVKFRDGSRESVLAASMMPLGVEAVETLPAANIKLARVKPGTERSTVEALKRMPGVAFAEPNYVYRLHHIPNDPFYGSRQWNMQAVNMPQAWDRPQGRGPVVGVIDSGQDYGHPDFAGRLAVGWGQVNGGRTVPSDDDHGHGTHVAGIIAATGDNNIGVAGVSWSATILPFKAANATGELQTGDWIYGLDWLADRGARVINMSFGGGSYSHAAQAAINEAWGRGVLLVASSGNDAEWIANPVSYPASYDNVISVGAVDVDAQRASFSNYNAFVDIAAPGGGNRPLTDATGFIYSTYWRGGGRGDYSYIAGTSQAAPHVSGAAALLLSHYPGLTNAQLRDLLIGTAGDLGAVGRDDFYGAGLLDVHAALRAAAPQPTATATSAPVPPTPTVGPGCIFSDVCQGDYFAAGVQYMVGRGAVSGYGDNTFRPYNNTTRGQLAKILVVGQGWAVSTAGGPHFSDVAPGSTFYEYVETAYNRGVISGYADGTFRWGSYVTRGQLAKIIVQAQNWTIDLTGGPHFSDVLQSNPFYEHIETAYIRGVIGGYGDGTFRWSNYATRGQITKIIHEAVVGR